MAASSAPCDKPELAAMDHSYENRSDDVDQAFNARA